jgi:hypothetical protein
MSAEADGANRENESDEVIELGLVVGSKGTHLFGYVR